MSADLEESAAFQLDFAKLRKVVDGGYDVVPVALQHADDGTLLFIGYANELAVAETFRTRQAVLWSTSRGKIWHKGATSGDVLDLVDVRINCEQNSLLYRVRPRQGGVCHTKEPDGTSRPTCYYREVVANGDGYILRPADLTAG
jgi:phosphoribosyl-AMP cyclohydrolase